MASRTLWTWVWVISGSWWWTGRPGVLQFMGSQRVGHDWATELNWSKLGTFVVYMKASQVVLMAKNLPANAGEIRDTSSICVWGISPGGRHGNPPVLLPEKSHGQRSLVDENSRGCKSADSLTEETTTTTTCRFFTQRFSPVWSFAALASFLFLPFPAFHHRGEWGALVPNCSPGPSPLTLCPPRPSFPHSGLCVQCSVPLPLAIPPVSQAAPVHNCEALVKIFSSFVCFMCPKPSSSTLVGFLCAESHMAPCPGP